MSLNPELIKLISILGGALVILIGGFIVQRSYLKKKKLAEEKAYSGYNNSSSSVPTTSSSVDGDYSNETIKNYISEYKSTYPRDSIKSALINAGNSESEVEKYLNKFF